jgi:hypothetical protein
MKIQVIKKANVTVKPMSSCPFLVDMLAEPEKGTK